MQLKPGGPGGFGFGKGTAPEDPPGGTAIDVAVGKFTTIEIGLEEQTANKTNAAMPTIEINPAPSRININCIRLFLWKRFTAFSNPGLTREASSSPHFVQRSGGVSKRSPQLSHMKSLGLAIFITQP